MKLPLSILVTTALLAGCSQEPSADKTAAAELKSGIYHENMDLTVKPGDDFTAYVNGTWVKNTPIPDDKASYSAGYIVHERNEDRIKDIIETSAATEQAPGSDEQKVGDLYNSFLDMDTRNARGIEPLAEVMTRIDAIENADDLARYFAYANRMNYGNPIGFFVYPDFMEPTRYALFASQSGLGLPDREYYLDDNEKYESIRKAYVEHIGVMFSLAGFEKAGDAAKTVMAFETQLAGHNMRKEESRDMQRIYNKYEVAKLPELMPTFNWTAFLEEAGKPDLEYMIVTTTDYMAALDGILHSTDLDTWKTYLKWQLINSTANRLSEAFEQQNFAFYGTTMTGALKQREAWRRGVGVVNSHLGEVIGKVFVKHYFPPEAKVRMDELVANLIKAYEVSINELDWMTPDTKVAALDKLHKFTPKIGYPDKWKDYSSLTISKDDYFGNVTRSIAFKYDYEMEKVGKAIYKHEWGMNPQTVNAYYSPAQNEIVFPAGILQPPYFDMNADDAVNYGAIGGVIGHELGHGFDDKGSTFDGDGVMRNWWTDADRSAFEARTSKLVEQYNGFKVFDDLNVNGEFTQGENIGDLSGLSIALKAYKMSLDGKPAPVLDGFTGEQRVFIGWAQGWLNTTREEALRQQVGTDPHSPARFRVNGVVRNIPEFYDAFDVQPGDALYLPPEERVKIW